MSLLLILWYLANMLLTSLMILETPSQLCLEKRWTGKVLDIEKLFHIPCYHSLSLFDVGREYQRCGYTLVLYTGIVILPALFSGPFIIVIKILKPTLTVILICFATICHFLSIWHITLFLLTLFKDKIDCFSGLDTDPLRFCTSPFSCAHVRYTMAITHINQEGKDLQIWPQSCWEALHWIQRQEQQNSISCRQL